MKNIEPKSIVIAYRLKNLRKRKGLSHAKLKNQLEESYGEKISIDSLKAYECFSSDKTKTNANLGMSIKVLLLLSQFYGVTTDYLLGLSDSESESPRRYCVEVMTKHTIDVEANSEEEAIAKACGIAWEYDADEIDGTVISTEEFDEATT